MELLAPQLIAFLAHHCGWGGLLPYWKHFTLLGTPSGEIYAFGLGADAADLFLRIQPTPTTVHQGDLITYAFPVWNLGPGNAVHEVLNTQVPEGTTFDYIRISGTPGLGTCTTPPYEGTGEIVCHENSSHGAEHHVDSAADGEGDGSVRDGDHRKCRHHGGYA